MASEGTAEGTGRSGHAWSWSCMVLLRGAVPCHAMPLYGLESQMAVFPVVPGGSPSTRYPYLSATAKKCFASRVRSWLGRVVGQGQRTAVPH